MAACGSLPSSISTDESASSVTFRYAERTSAAFTFENDVALVTFQDAQSAYAIENGRLGAPLKGATLIGNGPDVLTRVSMVGNDLKLDEGVGTCGKEGQSVPVGVGQPTLRIDGLTVGGTG